MSSRVPAPLLPLLFPCAWNQAGSTSARDRCTSSSMSQVQRPWAEVFPVLFPSSSQPSLLQSICRSQLAGRRCFDAACAERWPTPRSLLSHLSQLLQPDLPIAAATSSPDAPPPSCLYEARLASQHFLHAAASGFAALLPELSCRHLCSPSRMCQAQILEPE